MNIDPAHRTLLLAGLALILISFIIQKEQSTYSLTVEVKDLRNSDGVVQFALYNKEGSIPDERYSKFYKIGSSKIENGTAKFKFTELPEGKYAVNILHDENTNGKIDKGFFMPKEGIGFSNFSSIGFSNRPNFSRAGFNLDSDRRLEVKIIYL